ncbi:uncharacterized protein DUF2514 [Pseudomonas duriflava]|uniref:Uncharacterized protein DUF2514 n=1 Tax=Pseudomonas duriflava TaxID=459528 RepID=A0A562Q876_9PSED|nr:DUF2514 family protein [Pseudomonas duriflava]TWI52965.1 uncharacterized protein DUF2514 [Pseudomonas duriflava]
MTIIPEVLIKWALAIAIALGCLFGAYRYGVNTTNAKWEKQQSDAQAEQATLRATEEREARAKEQARQAEIEKIRTDAQQQIQAAEADARDADAASERLRKQADRLAQSVRSCSSDTGTTNGSETRPDPSVLLANVLSRIDERAGELAKEADRTRAAGSACERAYDSIRNNQ